MRRGGCLLLAALLGVLIAPAALADAITVPPETGLPWSDPNHASPTEVLASQVASRIANRAVTIRCEGQTDWNALAAQRQFDPGDTLGYVGFRWSTIGGRPVGTPQIAAFAELSPTACWDLQRFAQAASKPTKCSQVVTQTVSGTRAVTVSKRVRVRVRTTVRGRIVWKWTTETVTVTRQVPTTTQTQVPGPSGPCFAGGAKSNAGDAGFWGAYYGYAQALLTLAHESIHLGGAVGGVLNGYQVGDRLAEAHAECYGLQWMPYVAEQLGDTSDDALAIAQFAYDVVYPRAKGTPYWSGDCVPGGAMDIRGDKSGSWP